MILCLSVIVATVQDVTTILEISQYDAWGIGGRLVGIGTMLFTLSVYHMVDEEKRLGRLFWVGFIGLIIGTIIFHVSYPTYWYTANNFNLTPFIGFSYLFGGLLVISALSVSIATERVEYIEVEKNDEGPEEPEPETETQERSTTTVETTMEGSGVGLLGNKPSERVPTQTNRDDD